MPWMLLATAAMSAAKNAQDHAAQVRDQYVESAKARYSPWTGIKPGQVHYAQPASNMMQGLGAILAQKQNQDKNAQLNQLLQAKLGQQAPASGGSDMMSATDSGTGMGNDNINSILDKILNKSGGTQGAWKGLLADNEEPETQPTPIIGGGYSGGMGSYFS